MRKWKPVAGYEDLYEVSDDGLVMSLNYRNTHKPNLLKTPPHNKKGNGYARCVLRNSKGENKSWLVHRLVALAFLEGETKEKWTVNHKNGDKLDNRLENLEWASSKEQTRHADLVLGSNNRGSNCGMSKLTEEDVTTILTLLSSKTDIEIGDQYHVSSTTIYGIRTGTRWSHLTGIKPHKRRKARKLTPAKVNKIVALKNAGKTLSELSKRFKVSKPTISCIMTGKIWREVTGF
jgi:hypothetical protein